MARRRNQPGNELSIISWWSALALVLFVLAGAFFLAYVHASHASDEAQAATRRAQATADCVNQILGIRQQTTRDDAAAYLAFVAGVNSLFLPPTASERDKLAAIAAFQKTSLKVQQILTTDDKIRRAHPLGRC